MNEETVNAAFLTQRFREEPNEDPATSIGGGLPEEDDAMKKQTKPKRPSAGSRIIASLQEAVDWVEGQDVAVRVTTVEVPVIDVKSTRRRLGLSQADGKIF